jgi:hypothetical protein
MTDTEKRIAIAEACGWTCINATGLEPVGFDPSIKNRPAVEAMQRVPDYFNDLNAMHEAEKILFDQAEKSGPSSKAPVTSQFEHHLAIIVTGKRIWDNGKCVAHHTQVANIAHATARQRADAFLKTIEKL